MRGGLKAVWGTTAMALVLGALAAPAMAEEDSGDGEQVTVTATRSDATVDTVPSVVTVIDADDIEENLATDIKDLIRFEPGISVPTSPSRFGAALSATGRDGNSGFTIRGMGGNRVLFQVDGIRVPDGYAIGPNTFGRGDYVDLDLLQSVEIVRGPASALYGSDGLAGVVSFITRDPTDFLRDDENFAARARVSYASADESLATSLTTGFRFSDQFSGLLAYTRREASETDNQGEIDTPDSRRTEPNPQDIESNSVLARLVFEPSDQHRFRLTGDYGDRSISTEALSGRSVPPLIGSSVIDLDGLDENERSRVTLDYTFTNPGGIIDRAFVGIYSQTSWARQFSAEDRNTSADRTRDTTFDNDVWGVTAQGESAFEGGFADHRLVYGLDYSVSTSGAIRSGTVPTPPAVFPERPFPETEYTRTGLVIVDEISLLNGALTLFPGIRYDEYELSPQDDALYTGLYSDQSGDHISPKFGIVAWPTDNFGVFVNYAEGFKAPAPSEVNNFFENLAFGYTSIPNPNLDPETSTGYEAGIRGRNWSLFGGTWDWSASVFSSFYEDFISQQVVSGAGSVPDPFVYQYINLNKVEIWGLEGRANADWGNGWGLTIAASFAEGEQTTPAGTSPLESIDPFRLVTGLRYDAQSGTWGGQAIWTYSSQVDEDDVATPATAFRPGSVNILDLTAYWHVTDAATLRAGIFNATDATYWWWSDARGLSNTSATRDAYTQPGRNFSISVAYRF